MSALQGISRAVVSVAILISAYLPDAAAQQLPSSSDREAVVDTVKAVFAAASQDDLARFHSLTTTDFYMFDGGVRFSGDAMMALLKADHAAGRKYQWNVTDPDAHISGDTAWIAYRNKGSITDASGTLNLEWLESAFLQRQEGVWKIAFVHSTRVPKPNSEASGK